MFCSKHLTFCSALAPSPSLIINFFISWTVWTLTLTARNIPAQRIIALLLIKSAWLSDFQYRVPSLNSIWDMTGFLEFDPQEKRDYFLDLVWNSQSLLTSILSQKQQISFRKFVLEIYYGVNTGEAKRGNGEIETHQLIEISWSHFNCK